MAWLFLILAAGAALFTLPGGTRSPADRRLAQIVAFTALSIALMAIGLKPLGLGILLIGAAMFGISWLRERLMDDGFQDLEEGRDGIYRRKGARLSPKPKGSMTRAEALEVLGLEEGATADDITASHRRLIAKAHPDGGGSDYLAAKVNEARDILLD